MADNKRRAELEIALIDNLSGPSKRALDEFRRLESAYKALPRAVPKMMPPGAAAKAAAGYAPFAAAFAPGGEVGRTTLRNFDALGRAVTAQARGHAAMAAQAYGHDFGSIAITEAAMMARVAAFAAPAVAAYAGARAYADFAEAERALSRTGLKLGADRDTMAAIRREMGLIANRYAVPIEQVIAAFDSLAESGFELADARAALDGIVKATQGLGGSGQDTVNTFDAARKSIGLAQADAERFFDIIAAGGAAGKFEGSDLARYLPSLLPVAARQGYQGLEGAARLVGFIEVVRDYVGSSEEAATAVADVFEKISSPDVITNFKKFGVDLEKVLGDARAEGQDVLLVLSDILKKVTGGDATKLSQLFGDRDSRRAANVLLTAIDRVKDAQEELRRKSRGTIAFNVKVVTEDAQAKIDRLSNSWDAFVKSVGAGISTVATPALDDLTARMDRGQAYDAGLKRYEAEGGSKAEAREEFDRRYSQAHTDFNPLSPADRRARSEAFIEDTGSYGRGEAASIYARLDRILELRESAERAKANGERDPKMAGPYRPATIDDQPLRRGLPTPHAPEGSGLSEAEQRHSYGEGRRQGEKAVADQEVQQPRYAQKGAPDADYVDRRRRRLAEIRGEAPAQPAPQPASATPAPAPTPTPKPDLAAPVIAEASKATSAAAKAGTEIARSLSVTARPIVEIMSIVEAMTKTNALAVALRSLPGLAAAAGGAVRSMPTQGLGPNWPKPPAEPPLPRRASGGAVRRGNYLVGEQGPEVVSMRGNGYVTPNHRLGGGGDTYHININGSNLTADQLMREIDRRRARMLDRSRQIAMEGR